LVSSCKVIKGPSLMFCCCTWRKAASIRVVLHKQLLLCVRVQILHSKEEQCVTIITCRRSTLEQPLSGLEQWFVAVVQVAQPMGCIEWCTMACKTACCVDWPQTRATTLDDNTSLQPTCMYTIWCRVTFQLECHMLSKIFICRHMLCG
jgi:hypothetical protein